MGRIEGVRMRARRDITRRLYRVDAFPVEEGIAVKSLS